MAISCQSVSIDPMDEPSAVVRVMIADDSTPIRERLAALLWEIPGVVVIAETSDVPATMERVLDLLPPQQAAFSKEDGEQIVDAQGNRIRSA